MSELKPCRICGKVPKITTRELYFKDGRTAFEATFSCSNNDECRVLSFIARTEKEAVEHGTTFWNERVVGNND